MLHLSDNANNRILFLFLLYFMDNPKCVRKKSSNTIL